MGGDRRKFFVCGNWKMNGDKASIDGIVSFLVLDLIAIFTIRPKPDIRLLKYPDIRYQA